MNRNKKTVIPTGELIGGVYCITPAYKRPESMPELIRDLSIRVEPTDYRQRLIDEAGIMNLQPTSIDSETRLETETALDKLCRRCDWCDCDL